MAFDKVVDSTALEAGLTTIADAIRAKGGTADPLEFPQGMADAVAAIAGSGTPTTGPRFISEVVYTHAENWQNDSVGNTLNFDATYARPSNLQENEFLIIAVTDSKEQSAYQGKLEIRWKIPDVSNNAVFFRGPKGDQYRGLGDNQSFYITAGAKITVKKYAWR